MPDVMMALGGYRFSLSTVAYQKLQRTADWRWPTQDRLGAHPVRQYVGPGDQSITLDGTLYPHYLGLNGLPDLLSRVPALAGALGQFASGQISAGISTLTSTALDIAGIGGDSGDSHWHVQQLRAEADNGQPMLLSDGGGRIWGYWSVLSMQEAERRHMSDGAPLAVDFSIKLGYYGADAPGTTSPGSLLGAVRGLLGI